MICYFIVWIAKHLLTKKVCIWKSDYYSLRDGISYCISFLLLCNKSLQFSSLKQHKDMSQYLQVRSLGMVWLGSLLRLSPGWNQGANLGCVSHLELRILFQAHMPGGRIHFFAVNVRIAVPVCLLAVSQGLLSALEAVHIHYYVPSSSFKPAMVCWIFLALQITDFLFRYQPGRVSAFKGLMCLGQVHLDNL